MNVINLGDTEPTFNNVVIDPIRNDLMGGDYHNMLITGKPNIGKSNLGFVFCFRLDPSFKDDLIKRCAFTIPQVVNLQKEKTNLPYRAILFDEISDPLNNRNSMSREQRHFIVLKAADRIRNTALAMTVPYSTMADKGIRQLAHTWCDGMTKNKHHGLVRFNYKYNTFKLDPVKKEPIFRYPMVKQGDDVYKVKNFWVKKAPTKYWHQYVKWKLENLERIENKVVPLMTDEIGTMTDEEIFAKLNEVIDSDPDAYLSSKKDGTRYIDRDMFYSIVRENNIPLSTGMQKVYRYRLERMRGIGKKVRVIS